MQNQKRVVANQQIITFYQQVVFLLVSDDMRWVKKRIFERTKSKYDIFLAGNGHGDELFEVGKYLNSFQIISISKYRNYQNDQKVSLRYIRTLCLLGMDMAMMSMCNHTILSYGTFSFWSGFLAGGKRIIPAMILNQWKKPLMSELDQFTMTDEGLKYEPDFEKKKRLNLTDLVYF